MTPPPLDRQESTGEPGEAAGGPGGGQRRDGGPLRRALRWSLRGLLAVVGFVLLYALAAFGGARIPVNGDFEETPGGVPIYVKSNGVHLDLWVPVSCPTHDWSGWLPGRMGEQETGYLGFGWGERTFLLEVPTWDDLTFERAAAGVLWPTASLVRVSWFWAPLERSSWGQDRTHRVELAPEQYELLVEHLQSAFVLGPDGRPELVQAPAHAAGWESAFYEGNQSYHLFRTCNDWVNRGLARAGVRAALWTPFESGVRRHLPPALSEQD